MNRGTDLTFSPNRICDHAFSNAAKKDTPDQKRLFGKPGRTQIRLGLSFLADAFSSTHILRLCLFRGDGANHTPSLPRDKKKMNQEQHPWSNLRSLRSFAAMYQRFQAREFSAASAPCSEPIIH
jgi:hypothetical protein